jgi:hypothetical protein
MNMSALEILETALATLKQTSKDDVKLRTKELGIEIPNEPKLSSLIDHFIFDFNGIFNEIINSNKIEWVDLETIKRKNVNIENKKSHVKVALSF